jgi:hypothetical protein
MGKHKHKQFCIAFNGEDECGSEATQEIYPGVKSYCDTHYDNLTKYNTGVNINPKAKNKDIKPMLEYVRVYTKDKCTSDGDLSKPGCLLVASCDYEDGKKIGCDYRLKSSPGAKPMTPRSPIPSPRIGSPRMIVPVAPKIPNKLRAEATVKFVTAQLKQQVERLKKKEYEDEDEYEEAESEYDYDYDYEDGVDGDTKSIKSKGIIKGNLKKASNPNKRARRAYSRRKDFPVIKAEDITSATNYLEKIYLTNDIEVFFDQMKGLMTSFDNAVENSDKSFNIDDADNWSVVEDIIDKYADKFYEYLPDPDRLELVLSYLFDYDSRDLTKPFISYGFSKTKTANLKGDKLLQMTPYGVLKAYELNKKSSDPKPFAFVVPRAYDSNIIYRANRIQGQSPEDPGNPGAEPKKKDDKPAAGDDTGENFDNKTKAIEYLQKRICEIAGEDYNGDLWVNLNREAKAVYENDNYKEYKRIEDNIKNKFKSGSTKKNPQKLSSSDIDTAINLYFDKDKASALVNLIKENKNTGSGAPPATDSAAKVAGVKQIQETMIKDIKDKKDTLIGTATEKDKKQGSMFNEFKSRYKLNDIKSLNETNYYDTEKDPLKNALNGWVLAFNTWSGTTGKKDDDSVVFAAAKAVAKEYNKLKSKN